MDNSNKQLISDDNFINDPLVGRTTLKECVLKNELKGKLEPIESQIFVTEKDETEKQYWDSYYSDNRNIATYNPPSQFAAFFLTELVGLNINTIIDIASGDGRDSLFFAQYGYEVIAVEKSREAVAYTQKIAQNFDNLNVINLDITKEQISSELVQGKSKVFYARFFIHTLTVSELALFFDNISKIMKRGDYLFLEYRNKDDAVRKKITPKHFRAFYTADFVSDKAMERGLQCSYEEKGTGFAKWGEDNASVSRQIFQKSLKY